ncbi:MAG: DUF1501 domain-containing protein, partial [Planctomycetaceae bacterium]|nr:DUF1501 domain-containing protein [Planctomycetaceae bacterium]
MNHQRRAFLTSSGIGFGAAAFSSLLMGRETLADSESGSRSDGLPRLPRLPARIRRVIFLCMAGGPSHLETFDYKPELEAMDGKPMPE